MIYFDHAAGMPPPEGVLSRYFDFVREFSVNSETGHLLGRRVRRALDACAERLVRRLGLPERFGVLWFGGAAEAFRFFASTEIVRGGKTVSSSLEHPALHAALADAAATLVVLRCDRAGAPILPENAEKANSVVLHQLQSELGTTPDFSSIRAAYPDALIAVDSIQSAGKLDLPREGSVFFLSAGKLGVPGNGAALIFDREHRALRGWEELRRAWRAEHYFGDRLFAPPLLAMECALELKIKQRPLETVKVGRINRFLRENVAALGGIPTIPPEAADCRILHFHFPGKQGAVLVRMLSDAAVLCSAGSACAAESGGPSPAMRALGFSEKDAYGGLRLSFALSNDDGEARRFVTVLGEVLRRY